MAKPETKKQTKAGTQVKIGAKGKNKNRGQKRKQALSPVKAPVKKTEKTQIQLREPVSVKVEHSAAPKLSGKKSGSLVKRVLAAIVMLPVVIGALWAGYPFVDVLTLIVGVLLAWEWGNMIPSRNASTYTAAYIISLAVSLLIYDMSMVATAIVLVSLYVWLKARNEQHRYLLTLGVPYISIGIGALLWLYRDVFIYHPYNFYMTLWFFIMVWAMDIGGYAIGSTVKGPKLAPKISPNKTWAGLIGGILFAIVASLSYFGVMSMLNVMNVNASAQTFFAVLGGIIAAVSQIGDLIESAIKRKLGLKDSSNLIPGHGGVFDRVDGLIFAAPFVCWLFAYGLWLF